MSTQVDSDFNAITNSVNYIENYIVDLESKLARADALAEAITNHRRAEKIWSKACDMGQEYEWYSSMHRADYLLEACEEALLIALAAYREETNG